MSDAIDPELVVVVEFVLGQEHVVATREQVVAALRRQLAQAEQGVADTRDFVYAVVVDLMGGGDRLAAEWMAGTS